MKFDLAWFQEYVATANPLAPDTILQLLEVSLLEGSYHAADATIEVTVPYNRPELRGLYHIVRQLIGVPQTLVCTTLPLTAYQYFTLLDPQATAHCLIIKQLPPHLLTPSWLTARLQLNHLLRTPSILTDLIDYVALVFHVSLQLTSIQPEVPYVLDQLVPLPGHAAVPAPWLLIYGICELQSPVEPQWLGWALKYIVDILQQSWPSLETSYTCLQGEEPLPHQIRFALPDFHRLIGYQVQAADISAWGQHTAILPDILPNGHYLFHIPRWRPDLKATVDIIEELVFFTQDQAPTLRHERSFTLPPGYQPPRDDSKQVLQHLRYKGYTEVKNFTFSSATQNAQFNYRTYTPVVVTNPLTHTQSQLRTSMMANLLTTFSYNFSRQHKNISICELGKIFSTQQEVMVFAGLAYGSKQQHVLDHDAAASFHSVLGDIEDLLPADYTLVACASIPWLHPHATALLMQPGSREPLGVIGQVQPTAVALKASLLKTPLIFFEVQLAKTAAPRPLQPILPSLYPASFRDISFSLKPGYTFQHVQAAIAAVAPQIPLKELVVKSIYALTPQTHRLTLGLCFHNLDNQLTEERVHEYVARVMHQLAALLHTDHQPT